MRLIYRIGICWLAGQDLSAQVFLITGTQTTSDPETFATELLQVGTNGTFKVNQKLAREETGTQFISASYEWRKAVIQSGDEVLVVDYDKAGIAKQCRIPHIERGVTAVTSWLANSYRGPVFAWMESGADMMRDTAVRGMLLDSATPCSTSFLTLPPEGIRDFVDYGKAGTATGENAPLAVGLDLATGEVETFITKFVSIGYSIPKQLYSGMTNGRLSVLVNDSSALIVIVFDSPEKYRTLVYRKWDRTWHNFPIANRKCPFIRGLGDYIGAVEIEPKSRQIMSTGFDKWKEGSRKAGPDIRSRMLELPGILPGKLYLYNVMTEKVLS